MRWHQVLNRLDRISRTRELTLPESLMLERAINAIDDPGVGAKPRPLPWSREEEDEFADLIHAGQGARAAARAIGRPGGSGPGKWKRMQRDAR